LTKLLEKTRTEDRWLAEGKKRFIDKGIQGINIDEIGKSLNLARTSFYHFFKSKDGYLLRIFEQWEKDGTDEIIDRYSIIKDPVDRLTQLVYDVFTHNLENELFLFQLRLLAYTNSTALKIVRRAENKRKKFITNFFTDMGYSNKESAKKALYFYIYSVGRIDTSGHKKFSMKEIAEIVEELKEITKIN
jgi:AcrR family transcriptional regulator